MLLKPYSTVKKAPLWNNVPNPKATARQQYLEQSVPLVTPGSFYLGVKPPLRSSYRAVNPSLAKAGYSQEHSP